MNLVAPAAIWAILMLLAFPALLVLGSPQGVRYPWRALREAFRRSDFEAAIGAGQAVAFAEEVEVAATRATAAAERWQEVWERSETVMNAEFEKWLEADARLRRSVSATAFGIPWTAPTCAEYAGRERYLIQAVTAAVTAGDLPAATVTEAALGRGGWDARLHPLEQDLVVRRTVANFRRERYEAAVAAERAAWHDAELARHTSESLRHEAMAAAHRAGGLARTAPAVRAVVAAPAPRLRPAHA